jgi:hypothetical protein
MSESMFGNSEGGNIKYASIVAGKFVIPVSEEEAKNENGTLKPNHRVRENKNGVTVYEFTFTEVSGTADRVTTQESPYGKQLKIGLRNGDTVCSLGMNLFNEDGETLTMPAASIGNQIGLVDFSKQLKISLYKKDGLVRGLSFEQDGMYIPSRDNNPAYASHIATRPQAVKKTTLNGEKWDFSAPSQWQWNQIVKAIDRSIAEGVGNAVPQAEESLADVPVLQEDATF